MADWSKTTTWTKERVLKERPIFRIEVDGREVIGTIATKPATDQVIYLEFNVSGEVEVRPFRWEDCLGQLNGLGTGLYA